MNNVISFTPAQLFAAILAICAGISCIAGAIGWVIKWVQAARKPSQKLHERIAALEAAQKTHSEYLDSDSKRLEAIEAGSRVTQRALLALLKHGIDGNDVEGMKRAEAELQEYLIER